MTKLRKVAFTLALISLTGLSTLVQNTKSVLDGHWWRKQPYRMQYGLVAGVCVCRNYELSPAKPFNVRTVKDGVELLDTYYRSESHQKLKVLDAIEAVNPAEPVEVNAPPGGQDYPEKYGYYDEMWWQADLEERTGFLIGYIACLPNSKSMYPKPVEFYVERVTDWYDNLASGDKYEKIPVVLRKFKEPDAETQRND